jgi:uncharacterized protein YbjT (DUF2867 family)
MNAIAETAETIQLVALFGATGNISSTILNQLEEAKLNSEKHGGSTINFAVRVCTRQPDLLQERTFPFPIEICRGSVDELGRLDLLLCGVSRVFFCLPQYLSASDMVSVSRAFTDSAIKAGVKVIVRISSYGMDDRSASTCSQGSLGEAHIAGEKYMRESGLIVTSIRPTSFFSNFLKFDVPSIRSCLTFCSPLGSEASVNWISCEDIAAVVALSLVKSSLDGRVLDITGSENNTLSVAKMKSLIESKTGKSISYVELPLPESGEMNGLWVFLRSGGFSHSTTTFEEVTARKPIEFSDYLSTLEL